MSTRCTIKIKDPYTGAEYKIYRHCDGYPQGVLSDLKVLFDNGHRPLNDPEYFLANFIFLAKLSALKYAKKHNLMGMKSWLSGYGVCAKECKHGDLEYKYTIYGRKKKYTIETRIKIEKWDWEKNKWKTIFDGDIIDAFQIWADDPKGCHLREVLTYL